MNDLDFNKPDDGFHDTTVLKHVHPSFHQAGPVMPGVYEDDEEAGPDAGRPIDRQQIIGDFSRWIAQGDVTPLEIGRRFLIIQHIYKREGTQRELARRLRMDEGELSKKIQTVKMFLANSINAN